MSFNLFKKIDKDIFFVLLNKVCVEIEESKFVNKFKVYLDKL